jgi:hypothetical protein
MFCYFYLVFYVVKRLRVIIFRWNAIQILLLLLLLLLLCVRPHSLQVSDHFHLILMNDNSRW